MGSSQLGASPSPRSSISQENHRAIRGDEFSVTNVVPSTMPYVIVRESYINNSCLVDGLPLNEVRLITEKSSRCSVLFSLAVQGREELEAGVQHGVLQHPQRSGADWLQSHHQLLLRHRTQEVRHEGLHLDLVSTLKVRYRHVNPSEAA